jgi:sucrose-6-phosphate hydrolase SacC (GH32 family)
MALYLTDDRFCLLRSTDAKQWERIQNITLEHDSECPDFFPLLDEAGIERWVFWGGSGTYLIGDFDGALFLPCSEVQTCEHGSNGYAAQTWSNAPSGRCIQISWMSGGRYPEMPFNQQMSFPVELSLRENNGIWTLCRWPVEEIESITEPLDVPVSVGFDGSKPWPMPVSGDLFDIAFDISADDGCEVVMKIRGIPLTFDFERRVVNFRDSEVPMVGKGHLSVRLLIDRTSVELFLDGGQVSASFCYLPDAYVAPLVFNVRSGTANLDRVRVERVEDIWESVR